MDPNLLTLVTSAHAFVDALDDPGDTLRDAAARYQAVADYNPVLTAVEHAVLTADVADVPAVLDRLHDAAARAAARPAVIGPALDACARTLVSLVRLHGPGIVAAHRDDFARHADDLATAVAALPAGYADAARLVDAGPAAVKTFAAARDAAAHLDAIAAIRDHLAAVEVPLSGRFAGIETRYARFDDHLAADTAANAIRGTAHPLGLWGELLDHGGATLCLTSRAEQDAHAEALRAEEAEARKPVFRSRVA